MGCADNILEDIQYELTNYETGDDKETTTEEWVDVFYHLLYRVVHGFELGDIVFTRGDKNESK